MNRNGLKIGEFSRLCRVTVRALRHYEKIKLLVPEIIDYSTGYRYYSIGQMQMVLNIVRLKGLGFSLSAIIVASHRAEIPSYDELGKLCYMTIGPEMARLGCECPEPGYCYTIEHQGSIIYANLLISFCRLAKNLPA